MKVFLRLAGKMVVLILVYIFLRVVMFAHKIATIDLATF